ARAAGASGVSIELPEANGRRDGSGVPAPAPIAAIAGALPEVSGNTSTEPTAAELPLPEFPAGRE
ncbi:hypothetical protein, partial [Segeticoccus rhizosphaerae]|uniref:hypothetical protein n=1 Tax=Segeticoccus rhizosphaerae TaxID=1104777 RepID=UPI0013968FE2